MFIQTEETPNPQTLKFIPGVDVMESGTVSIARGQTGVSPLADSLFTIDEVESVFFGDDFVTITKSPDADWSVIKPKILSEIMDFFITKQPVLNESLKLDIVTNAADDDEDDEVVAQIKELIDSRVRPAVAEDGGDIIFQRFENGIVYLEMHGACSGCPSAGMTLKEGIENLLKHYIPEVESVEEAAA